MFGIWFSPQLLPLFNKWLHTISIFNADMDQFIHARSVDAFSSIEKSFLCMQSMLKMFKSYEIGRVRRFDNS